jgi:large subunit ribosomal protein L7Ae
MPKATKKAAGAAKPAAGGVTKSRTRSPLIEKRPRNFGIGGDIQPKRDLTRFVRWPKYIRIQRQKRVLGKRLKVPPVVNQFTQTLDKNAAQTLFTLLEKYSPETKVAKKQRLLAQAAAGAAAPADAKKPLVVKFGLNHVTGLVEQKKAKLVVIAHDVDPIELVLWLPTLCRKKGVPFVIVKGKSRLGRVVHQKTAAVVAVVDVDQKDKKDLADLVQRANDNFVGRYTRTLKTVGGGVMGPKHTARKAKYQRRVAREATGLEQQKKQKAVKAERAAAEKAAADKVAEKAAADKPAAAEKKTERKGAAEKKGADKKSEKK